MTDHSEEDVPVEELLDNMGEPPDRVECPIEGCEYDHRDPMSVAGHVSSSGLGKHVWENTDYDGWKAFVRAHGGEPE